MAKQALILTNGKTLIDWSLDHDYSQDGPEIYRPDDHTIITDDFTALPDDWKEYAWIWNSSDLEFDKTADYCSCMLKELVITAHGPTDNVDVSGVNILILDTSLNNVIIGGFTGGKKGQMLFVVRTNSDFIAKLEHAENENDQKIYLSSQLDDILENYGGWLLYCDGINWYEIRKGS